MIEQSADGGTITMSDLCGACGRTRQWHRDNHPHHQFVGDDGPLQAVEIKSETLQRVTSGDAVLRLALVKAGVLTDEDLDQAEKMLRLAQQHQNVAVSVNPETRQYEMLSIDDLAKRVAGR
jgi:hypothetical protein